MWITRSDPKKFYIKFKCLAKSKIFNIGAFFIAGICENREFISEYVDDLETKLLSILSMCFDPPLPKMIILQFSILMFPINFVCV